MRTIYEYAAEKMNESIQHYFEIEKETKGFTQFTEEIFHTDYAKQMILAGKSLEYLGLTKKQCVDTVNRVHTVKFDIEKGVSAYVYENVREYINILIEKAEEITDEFSVLTPALVKEHSYLS